MFGHWHGYDLHLHPEMSQEGAKRSKLMPQGVVKVVFAFPFTELQIQIKAILTQ